MGGGGRGKERGHHFFLFDLVGLYKYDLQMKISPKKLSATQAKEFITIIWKKNLHNLFSRSQNKENVFKSVFYLMKLSNTACINNNNYICHFK